MNVLKNLLAVFVIAFIMICVFVGSFVFLDNIKPLHKDQLTTTSGDDVAICMKGKINRLVYISGHLYECMPRDNHRQVVLTLKERKRG